ncbi:MAG TPA: TonB-dependent receptor [Cyclobacteriaceae bacterium]|jgi:TonB-linked SusC/RagA family outer membrane protein|nr:TonB-dependent receptor [Cyclobacteriaceae bacterium]
MPKSLHNNRLRIPVLALVFLFLTTWAVHAQQLVVTGTVKSNDEPVPGATVLEKGTSNGTVTNSDGQFSISVSPEATLVFSFIGMAPKEVKVSGQTSMEVTLDADATQLGEVVVVGYGEVERKDLTTSVSSISSKQLKDIPINSAAQALAGRLAGVQVIASEGTPNAQVQIRVRGGGSITQDNTPLYIVDGAQVENALSVLSPQDIASIDVLKDASATAIYGARGANGVVIITTKGGFSSRPIVSYNGLVGTRNLANKLDVMNPYDFVMYQYERSRGNTAAQNTFQNTYGNFNDLDLYKQVPNVDWQKESFGRTAVMQTHNISVAGGTKKTQYNVSVTSNQEQGVQLGSDFNRQLINARVNQKITSFLQAAVNVRYNNTVVNGAGTSSTGSSSTNRLRQSVKYRPLLFPGQDVYTYDSDYAAETNSNSLSLVNPVLLSKAEYQKDLQSTFNISGNITFQPTKYLTFISTVGYDIFHDRIRAFSDTITNNSMQNGQGKPIASIDSLKRTTFNNSNVLTFSLHKLSESFAKHNKLDVLVGQEVYQATLYETYNESHGYPSGIDAETALNNMYLGTSFNNPAKPKSELPSRLLSFFGRASFSRDDKYMAAFTLRADGSSKFLQGHQWGYFPSASAAWRISNEAFFNSLRSTLKISDLKFRLSYGESGNNRFSDFLYLPQFQLYPPYTLNNSAVTGYGQLLSTDTKLPSLNNSNLKWETTISRNIGIDLGLFENRVQLSVDIYHNNTRDLIVNTPVPSSSGYTTQLQNVGSTSNKGVEIQLSATPIQTNKFTWKSSFNISFNKNRVDDLGRYSSYLFNSGWNNNSPSDYYVGVGQPTGTIWGLVTDGFYKVEDFQIDPNTNQFVLDSKGAYVLNPGVANDKGVTSLDPKPGVIKYKDFTGDGQVTDADRTTLGSALPTFFGGFNNQFSYKNFDLSIFINFQYGNKVLNANKLEFTSGYTTNSNLLSIMNDRWKNIDAEGNVVTDPNTLRAMNTNAKIWSPLTGASSFFVNSWAVEDGSFIRINNITLGYTFPAMSISKLKISKLRLYATGNNIAVFTNYSGYDPEVNTRRGTPLTPGVDYSAYPRSHNYIFGVNVSF